MSEGEGFFNPMAAYVVWRGLDDNETKDTRPNLRRDAHLLAGKAIDLLLAVTAITIVGFTVARGSTAVRQDTDAIASSIETTTEVPDLRAICREVDEPSIFAGEATWPPAADRPPWVREDPTIVAVVCARHLDPLRQAGLNQMREP